MEAKKVLVWFKRINNNVISKILYLHVETWPHKKKKGSLCIF
jgi:hypothetical protein